MTPPRAARAKAPVQPPLPLAPEEGVHIGLPIEMHHGAPAVGSSDLQQLDQDSHSWWFASAFNPDRKQAKVRSAALTMGDALHTLMLEGDDAYTRKFIVEPDSASSRYAKTRDAMRDLLRDRGVSIRGEFDPAKLNQLCRRAGIAHLVWDTAFADYEAAKRAGRAVITEDQNRRLRFMAHLVDQHPDLGPNLRRGLSEVSVFWRREDRPEILLRARFDKLLPGACIDLKTFSNQRDKSPEEATFDSIAEYGYDVQAELYREARVKLAEFVRAKRVHAWHPVAEEHSGGMSLSPVRVLDEERKALDEIVAVDRWRWIWIFYQVRSDDAGSARAPIIVPWWTWPEGQMFTDARAVIDRALDNYTARIGEFGLHKPWSEIRPIKPLPVERLKRLSYKRNIT